MLLLLFHPIRQKMKVVVVVVMMVMVIMKTVADRCRPLGHRAAVQCHFHGQLRRGGIDDLGTLILDHGLRQLHDRREPLFIALVSDFDGKLNVLVGLKSQD
uniref:Putative secreted peptide n=1 Tax=Anopheles braziliensis TaxID=58242 RepID=A0A2M3ZSQ1_9DIPT